MSSISTITLKRLKIAVPKFKKILKTAKERDINESNTVTIITDMLEEVFGFDKYHEITREHHIQGTYCDLAVTVNDKIEYLIEAKAIGLTLNNKHLKQAVNYASRSGIKWVILTNGTIWEIHRVILDIKVESQRMALIDFSTINLKSNEDQEKLFLLCKRGVAQDRITEYYERIQHLNGSMIAALLLTDVISSAIRRELRKLKPNIKVSIEEIKNIIKQDVIKRERIESDIGIEAARRVARYLKKQNPDTPRDGHTTNPSIEDSTIEK